MNLKNNKDYLELNTETVQEAVEEKDHIIVMTIDGDVIKFYENELSLQLAQAPRATTRKCTNAKNIAGNLLDRLGIPIK